MDEKVWIGYSEVVALPDWGVSRLKVKVDTGARTSALHVEDLEEVADHVVRFRLVREGERDLHIETPVLRRSHIKSSNGQSEERYVVVTRLRLGAVEKTIEISLTRRGEMRYPRLRGRSALAGDFWIDPARRGLASKAAEKKKTVKKKKTKRKTA